MYIMSETTKKNIEQSLGISIADFSKLSADEEKEWIRNRTNCLPKFSKKRRRWIIGRGNPLLSRRKIRTSKDLKRKSRKLFGI